MNKHKRFLGLKLMLYIIIFLWMHCLYLFNYPEFMSKIEGQEAFRYFLGLISVLLFFMVFVFYNNTLKRYNGIIKLLFAYIFVFISHMMYTTFFYNKQSLIDTLHVGAPFLITLLVPVFLVVCTEKRNFKHMLLYIDLLTFLWSMILIYQSIHFIINRSFALDFYNYFTTGVTFRNDNLRLSLGSIANLMIVYRIYKMLYLKSSMISSIYNYISIATSLYVLIFIQQTRMYTFTIALVFMILLVFSGKSQKSKILSSVVLLSFIYFTMHSNIIMDFIKSFSIGSDKGDSTLIRLFEVKYYLLCFLKNPLFGNSFASGMEYPSIEHGIVGNLYYVDVGIIGLLGQIGLGAFVFYIIPFIRIIKTTILSIKNCKNWEIDVAISIYIFLTSWSLLVIHPVQIMGYVLVLSYFEQRRYEINYLISKGLSDEKVNI